MAKMSIESPYQIESQALQQILLPCIIGSQWVQRAAAAQHSAHCLPMLQGEFLVL